MRHAIRETTLFVALGAVLVAATLFAYFELPNAVVGPEDLRTPIPAPEGTDPPPAPTAVDLVQARNGARTAAVALIAGLGAAIAAGFSARTFYLTRRSQLLDRYSKAAEQLARGDQAACVAAVGDLRRLAREAPMLHPEIMRALAAFVRSHQRSQHDGPPPSSLQDACEALGQRNARKDRDLVIHLAGADLRFVQLDGACLRNANLRDAHLRGAFLRHADLRGAIVINAVAPSVRFDGALLDGSEFDGANLDGATFDGAIARAVSFRDVDFNDTSFAGADLRDCNRFSEGATVKGALVDDARIGPWTKSWWEKLRERSIGRRI